MTRWAVLEGDCAAEVNSLAFGTFDAIVTSPPYPGQRTYASGDPDGESAPALPGHDEPRERPTHHSRRKRRQAVADYPDWLVEKLDAIHYCLKPTGSAMVNLGVVLRDGEETPYIDEVVRLAREREWKLLHRIVWHKLNSVPPSHPAFLNVAHEYVLWLALDTAAYRGYDEDTRTPHAETTLKRIGQDYSRSTVDERYVKRGARHPLDPRGARPTTVYPCGVGRANGRDHDHPAPMPLDLAMHLVSLACPPGGLVLDPFAGAGTTGVACRRRGRNFVGIELRPKYADMARDRIRDDEPLLAPHDEVPEDDLEQLCLMARDH